VALMATISEGGSRCTQDPTKQCLNPETCRVGMPCHSTRPQRGADHNDPEP